MALAALSGAATLLTSHYHEARLARAATHLQRGQTLVTRGALPAAIVELCRPTGSAGA